MQLQAVSKDTSIPLDLLRVVRDVMRAPEDAQTRLNQLTDVIAQSLSCEVCSIYFFKAGDFLELYATKGLRQEAVHQTRLRMGEGLVGETALQAKPVHLAEARTHPKFVLKPETGEEPFHSFVGVPIIHGHNVIGVLVVQSTELRIFSEAEIEVLETSAMVIAEMAIGGGMVGYVELTGEQEAAEASHYITGVKLSPGVARARAVLHKMHPMVTMLVSDDPEAEEQRFHTALSEMQERFENLLKDSPLRGKRAQEEIFDAYRMFMQDRGWITKIVEAIRSGLTAEAAVKKVQEYMRVKMEEIASPYIRSRMTDLDDVSYRLLSHLTGEHYTAAHGELPDAYILVARSLGPSELLEYAGPALKGVVLEEGSSQAHVAIVAKMMDIPMVSKIEHAREYVRQGDSIIINGDNGEVYIRPPEDVDAMMMQHMQARDQRQVVYESTRHLPSETIDGHAIGLNLNIGLTLDAAHIGGEDIFGIGLFRTELPYLASYDFPTVDEQHGIYEDVFKKAGDKPVIFRSFDIGGDKHVPYISREHEENPAMGWRASRIAIDRPSILRSQSKALIRAAKGKDLYVMFPFIADVSEFLEMKELLMRELERARVEGYARPTKVYIGSMIEIPSILFQLPELLKHADFVSIGSNDLLQFLFAADRNNTQLSGRYDPLCPAVMRMIRDIVKQCDEHRVRLGFCGDMATKPLEAMALIGCGVQHLSMPLSAVGPIKEMVRSVNYAELEGYMHYLVTLPEHSIRYQLEDFARDHGVLLNC